MPTATRPAKLGQINAAVLAIVKRGGAVVGRVIDTPNARAHAFSVLDADEIVSWLGTTKRADENPAKIAAAGWLTSAEAGLVRF